MEFSILQNVNDSTTHVNVYIGIVATHGSVLVEVLISIQKVAKLAKVSSATVSRTINNSSSVSPETAARVRKVIAELKFFPNSTAKSLVSGRSHILGIIVSDITNPFFPELVKGFEHVAMHGGYEIILTSSNYDASRMDQCVRRLIQRKVDGVAIMTSEFDPAVTDQLSQRKVPTVFLDVGKVDRWVSNVRVDYQRGIREAVDHLLGQGHSRIAFIGGPANLSSARIRKSAFLTSMKEKGIMKDSKLIVEGNHRIDGGIAATEKLLALNVRPTAILASNDLTAMGALHALRKAGLQVPADISLVGFDDIELAQYTDPPLTTVRLSRSEIGSAAFQALLGTIQKDAKTGSERQVTTRLVIRQSTGAIPH